MGIFPDVISDCLKFLREGKKSIGRTMFFTLHWKIILSAQFWGCSRPVTFAWLLKKATSAMCNMHEEIVFLHLRTRGKKMQFALRWFIRGTSLHLRKSSKNVNIRGIWLSFWEIFTLWSLWVWAFHVFNILVLPQRWTVHLSCYLYRT